MEHSPGAESATLEEYANDMVTLNGRLGYPDDARLLLLTCDNLGVSHSENTAVYDALRHGAATDASLMVPAPWARHAVRDYRGSNVGVHLTLISQYDGYRWAPITLSPSLRDGNGGFPSTVNDLWDHGDLDEVRRECRAQIERAIVWGFDVTHLDSHLNALVGRPEFFDIYLDMAVEFSLPIRLDNTYQERNSGFNFRSLAAEEGVLFADHYVRVSGVDDRTRELADTIAGLSPGVTEITFAPATDTPELRAINTDWPDQLASRDALMAPEIPRAIAEHGVVCIDYAVLRDAQRTAANTPAITPR